MNYLLKEIALDDIQHCLESLTELVERHMAWSDRCHGLLVCGTSRAEAGRFLAEHWLDERLLCPSLRLYPELRALIRSDRALRNHAETMVSRLADRGALDAEDYGRFTALLTDVRREILGLETRVKGQLSAASRLTAQVFENAAEAVIITDRDGVILDVNATFCRLTEFSRKEVVGRRPSLLKSGRHDEQFYTQMWETLEREGRWQGEVWNRRKGGEIFPEWLSISAMTDDGGQVTHYVGMFSDISPAKQNEARLARLAHYDPLTDLPNRGLFREHLEQALNSATRCGGQLAVLFVDLDRFKNINDTLGHNAGDTLLVEVARRLRGCLRQSDTVSRLGGDEFTLILRDVAGEAGVIAAVEKIREVMSVPHTIAGHELFVTPSIGISLFPVHGTDADALLKAADMAMYRAKELGRNGYQFYHLGSRDQLTRAFRLEGDLRHALERKELTLYYQPQVEVESGLITGVEALLRWRHPEHGLLGPDEFVPIAEESGLIDVIGEWVIRTACMQNRGWQEAGLPAMKMAVNLSGHQLRQKNLPDQVERALKESGLAPHHLTLELTETSVMQNPSQAAEVLEAIRALGVRIAIDDFGRGYTSLSYLKRLPVDVLKIDRSFIAGLGYDGDDQAISRAIIALAESLHLKVVAEGVEQAAQLDFLRASRHVDAQGFLFSRPVPAEAIVNLLGKRGGLG